MKTYISSCIGSVSKVPSAIALLHLFDKQKLSSATVQEQLDMHIWDKLPKKWQDSFPGRNIEKITYRHLLQHRCFRISDKEAEDNTTGSKMSYALSQGVNTSDLANRQYNNFNIAILLFLIPAIAYPEAAEDIYQKYRHLNVDAYSKEIGPEYGKLYEKYMHEVIFAQALEAISPTCRPEAALSKNRYAKHYSSIGDNHGSLISASYCRSQGGWYMSAQELAIFTRTFAFTNRYFGPTTRDSLYDPDNRDDRIVYARLIPHNGFQRELGQKYWAFHGGNQGGYQAALVKLPDDYYGIGMVNSNEMSSGEIARVLIESFYDATRKLLRRDTAVGEFATDVALAVLGSRAVTAIRQTNGDLRLDVWRLTNDGWKHGGSTTAGTVHEIAITAAGTAGGVVTGLRDGDGNLKLITWKIDGDGIRRQKQALMGAATRIAMRQITHSDFNGVVVAMRDEDGNLRLISYAIGPNGELDRRGMAVRGAVSRVAITNVRESLFNGVITAVRDSAGHLSLHTFDISNEGRTITFRHVESEHNVDDVAISSFDDRNQVIVAVRDGEGNLRVIEYTIGSDGSIERRGTATAGAVSKIAICEAHRLKGIVTAVRDGDDNLRVIPWESRGRRIVRVSGAAAGHAAGIAIARSTITIDGHNYLVTALCDGDGKLRLISWDTNF